MRNPGIRSRRGASALLIVGAIVVAIPGGVPASAQDRSAPDPSSSASADGPRDLEAVGLEPEAESVGSSKALTSRIAESDPKLVARTDGARVPVMIKLDYDPIATYSGGIKGLPATSPSTTGRALTDSIATNSAYAKHVEQTEGKTVGAMQAAVPSLRLGTSYQVVYGGVSATVPANRVDDLLEVPGVVAVQADTVEHLLSEPHSDQIGAPTVWAGQGGQATAGSGVLYGNLDTGVWPEHPSFADTGVTPSKPTRPDGTPIECDFGDDPLTPETDVFACNDKLVGGRVFLDGYNASHPGGGEVYPDTARDSGGHGTHTASTTAGNVVEASIDGASRGQISGVAPGAWIVSYKVCGSLGCNGSDTAAAVQAAVLDGVDVINYSISGGTAPATNPTELAFLDAYAAGVFVSASAGNSGPDASTVNHLGPWTTTVAATTSARDFQTTVNYTANGVPGSVVGNTVNAALPAAAPVVLSAAPPYSDYGCDSEPAPGTFTGKIVLCNATGGNYAPRSYRLKQAGAVGMIVTNLVDWYDMQATNNFLPTVHLSLDQGNALKAAIATGPTTASWGTGVDVARSGDQVARFSSRGPSGGKIIKPDLAAPGAQVLAGMTPTPESVDGGAPGELFQSEMGTSMAAPHVAGAAALLKAGHPELTPGEIRSALMTTATSGLTRAEDGQPATPFDEGSGRIRVDRADGPGLVLDETAARLGTMGLDPVTAKDLNLASVYTDVPGRVTTTRTFRNTGAAATYTVGILQPGAGSSIAVTPGTFTIPAGDTQTVKITIDTSHDSGTELGAITLNASGRAVVRLPVAFNPKPEEVSVTPTGCTPNAVAVGGSSTCSYAIDVLAPSATTVHLEAAGDAVASVTGADLGATTTDGTAIASVVAPGSVNTVPTTAAGSSPFGYVSLESIGVTDTWSFGDEGFLHFDVDPYVFNGVTYDSLSVNANGYLVAGDAEDDADNVCCDMTQIGDAARPNSVIAPFWTDLDGTGTDGLRIAIAGSGGKQWAIAEWDVNVFGTTSRRTFQAWIGLNGTQDVSFAYDPADMPGAPAGQALLIGAENADGEGIGLDAGTAPTGDLRVSSPNAPSSLVWNVQAQGTDPGTAAITAELASPQVVGSGTATNPLTVAPTVPGAPTIGVATPGGASARVSWTAPTDDGGSPITGYVVTPYVGATALASRTFASTATTQTFSSLANERSYTFKVAAKNAEGVGAQSAASNAVIPIGTYYLRNANSGGVSTGGFPFGGPGDIPVAGDWDGNGTTTIGVFHPSTATWYLRNSNSAGVSIGGFKFGAPGDIPVVGDWDGDGKTTIGVFRPATATWYLRNSNSAGVSIGGFKYGSSDVWPVAGDWDGNGTSTIGVYRPSTATWYLRNANSSGLSTGGFDYGSPGDIPVVGDWDNNGMSTVGLFRITTAVWYLRNANSPGLSIGGFKFGAPGFLPVSGDWDGNGTSTIGVYHG